ncbi:hypothetical protein [Ruegeria atlantica]|uniref:hypothetical protein n=1 Tax=Ruegeria atlantica TaxID=81569 RepID=UPI00147C564E|nr:hypothetical protein [Ruegeria atlantica]
MFEIVDDQACRSWLSQQDRQTRVWFAARMALRAFPAAIGEVPFDQRNSLRLLHHLLIATVGSFDLHAARKAPSLAFGGITAQASIQGVHNNQLIFQSTHPSDWKALYDDELPEKGTLRREVGENAICNAISWAIGFREVDHTVEFGGGYWELAWLAGAEEASRIATSDAASPNVWPPLWGVEGRPNSISSDYSNLDDFFESDRKTWGFWLRWFKAFHDGEPMPWELSRLIASTLSNDDWKEGPEHVAREIEKIEALFGVRHSLSELSRYRSPALSENRLGIGGNNPPEGLQLSTSSQESLTILWAAVDEIAEQSETERPDRSLVRAALKKLTEAWKRFISWVGKKMDLAVDTIIKWSIPATGGYYALNPTKIQALIDAVKTWIETIP